MPGSMTAGAIVYARFTGAASVTAAVFLGLPRCAITCRLSLKNTRLPDLVSLPFVGLQTANLQGKEIEPRTYNNTEAIALQSFLCVATF